MSKRNKLQKFADLLQFPNVFENFTGHEPTLIGQGAQKVDLKGKWREVYFNNNHPITLELACGRGEYTLDLARQYPDRNFIGVDIKGARIWKGAGIALEESLSNTAFLRTRIEQIAYFFDPGEVQEIWITFPDPFLRGSKQNRRLTALPFLERYAQVLATGGLVHLKTDETSLYEFTLSALQKTNQYELLYHHADIYRDELPLPELETKTYYEKIHLKKGKTIKYVRFRLV